MAAVKFFHVVAAFLWVGSLVTLSLFLVWVAGRPEEEREKLYSFFRWGTWRISLPACLVTLGLGVVLLTQMEGWTTMGWLHMKLTFIVGLVVAQGVLWWKLYRGRREGRRQVFLPLLVIVLLMATLAAGMLVRDKEGEIRKKVLQQENSTRSADPENFSAAR